MGHDQEKKAKSKAAAKKPARKKREAKPKTEANPAEVRKEVSKLVAAHASDMTEAVIAEGEKGQLAPVKCLFEMASIFPAAENGEQATTEEDCLAKLLLSRIEPEKKADEGQEQKEAREAAAPATEAGTKDGGSEGMKEAGQGSDSLDSHPSKTTKGGAPAAEMAKEVAETKEIQISDAQQLATVSS